MFSSSRAAILVLGLSFSACAMACGERNENGAPRIVVLQKVEPNPTFYWRAGHHAILVAPVVLQRQLEKTIEQGGTLSDRHLLAEFRRPTQQKYTDLYSFGLENPLYMGRIEYALAEILERGDGAVIDAWARPGEDERVLEKIVVQRTTRDSYEGRSFCTPSGDLLLRMDDRIV